ncbi:hypothetical protein EJ03DRAFT_262424, partial [Teratosphaeria nubilosa]
IDAICINQLHLAERGHQARLMKDVYSLARRVVVWLGELDAAALERAILSRNGIAVADDVALPEPAQVRPVRYLLDHVHAQRDLLSDLESVPGPHWWERLWVVQEFVLA